MQPNYPPQGYAQPQPQYPPAGPAHPVVQAYNQYSAAQQYQPAPIASPVMAAPPKLMDPTGGGAGDFAPVKVRELLGRACAITPKRINPPDPQDKYGPKESLVCDILVLDGPTPLEYGASGDRMNPAPPCFAVDQIPVLLKGVIINNVVFVNEGRKALESNGIIACRIVMGNTAFLPAALGSENDPQAADAPAVRARMVEVLTAIQNGQFVNPTPREINGGPRKKDGQPGQAPAQQNYTAAPAQAYPAQAYPAPAAPAPQVQYAAPVQPVQAYVNAVPPVTTPPAPVGWDPNVWAQLTPEQRAQFAPPQ